MPNDIVEINCRVCVINAPQVFEAQCHESMTKEKKHFFNKYIYHLQFKRERSKCPGK